MEKRTVKRRIFISNALMVLVTLVIFLSINLFLIKIYSESIEAELKNSLEQATDAVVIENLLKNWTIHRNEFFVLFGIDGILCIFVLVMISQLFTKNLARHIMEPLNALEDGAKRMKHNDLTQNIEYTGDIEFENVCAAFNDMRESVLTAQEKSRRYEKARTDMIAGISHDLRTPLTAVRGTIKGLMDGIASTPEQQEKFLQTAYRRTEEIDTLLNQLFYFSKMETGNMPLSFQTIEISAFLQNYVNTRQRDMEAGREKITVHTNEITADVCTDPKQLQRVLDNLLENSRKYSEKIPLKIDIVLDRTPQSLCICFKDNGLGVSEEKLPYIFEEFYRCDESRNKKEGNGLGLYIVKYLIGAMGGSVRAENQNGLAIYLELPPAQERRKSQENITLENKERE